MHAYRYTAVFLLFYDVAQIKKELYLEVVPAYGGSLVIRDDSSVITILPVLSLIGKGSLIDECFSLLLKSKELALTVPCWQRSASLVQVHMEPNLEGQSGTVNFNSNSLIAPTLLSQKE